MTDSELLDTLDRLLPVGQRWNFFTPGFYVAAVNVEAAQSGQSGIRDAIRAAIVHMTPVREPGFYWVSPGADKWEVAEWAKGGLGGMRWYRTGSDAPYEDRAFSEIGERAQAPGSANGRYTATIELGEDVVWDGKVATIRSYTTNTHGEGVVELEWSVPAEEFGQVVRRRIHVPETEFRQKAFSLLVLRGTT